MAGRVSIHEIMCKGCGLCTIACPKKILVIDQDNYNDKGYNPIRVADMDKCTACAMCAVICPDSAIKVEKD